jgi:3',5'-cyclic AMP phosphodiesterase CpdA
VRVIVLDLTRRDGGSRGRVAPGQPAWLEDQLDRAGERWVLVASHQPIAGSSGGARLLDALDHAPRVVAVLSGHTHESSIEPRRSATGGYWLIGTPSLADYPQQARALRLRETAAGGVVVETWMVDTAPGRLADISRDLAFLDAQGGRPQGAGGAAEDRNVRLYRGPPL